MEAIGTSYFLLFTLKLRENGKRASLCSTHLSLGRQEIDFLKPVRYGFPLHHKFIHPISAAQTNAETEEIQTSNSDNPRTVRVKFELRKECVFGQHFGIVGDDPALGLWEPSCGVPLIWSDGHVWTAEVDIPSGKLVKYKFILKGSTGTLSWQPGPDRILVTWDTENTITVFEDWDNPELQNVVEEEPVDDPSAESSDVFVVFDESNAVKLDEDLGDEELVEHDASSSEKEEGTVSRNDETSDLWTSDDETSVVSDEGVPVLVPGLSSMPHEEAEDVEIQHVEVNNVDNDTTCGYDETKDLAEPELKDEQESELESKEEVMFKSKMQWGRRTLEKFLSSLGFQ